MGRPNGNRRRAEIESWFALVSRIIAFFAGLGMLGWQTVLEHTDRPYLIVAGIGLCGPAVAQSVATVFASIRGQDQRDRNEKPQG